MRAACSFTDGAVSIALDDRRVSFEPEGGSLRACGDAALSASLIAAMKARAGLHVADGMTARLRSSEPALQSVIGAFFGHPAVEVTAAAPPEAPREDRGVGAFFSGGVDSFFTARRRPDVDTLIFVHGFDLRLQQEDLRAQASAAARAAAARLGKRLVEVRTDMRSVEAIGGDWGAYHGAAMATVAHLLSGELRRVYIPATYAYADLFPWGSHPLLDPLWSGDHMTIEHDAAEVTRFDKIGALVDDPVAQEHLRVCWENRAGAYNCGECEKCTRTMIALRAFGALDRFRTFPRPLALRRVRFGELRDQPQRAFTKQGIRRLEQTGSDPELAAALRWRLRVGPHRYRVRMALTAARSVLRRGR